MLHSWEQCELERARLDRVRAMCAAFLTTADGIEAGAMLPGQAAGFRRYYLTVAALLRRQAEEIGAEVEAGGSTLTALAALDQLHAELLTAHDRMRDHLLRGITS